MGNITLAPGDNKTVTITNDDIPFLPDVPTTVTGGKLPKTSTLLYEILLIGAALTLVGAVVLGNRKRY